ncbi:tyrosine protein kinase [Paenibacillaceae bacterium WGS1546]|uniref:tyrosine protein kinase n=1 Tax=Cohnella sp. WGS1546 TaxID=3366810 RepID=UPI00372D36C6
MRESQSSSTNSWTPGYGQDSFPGIQDPFSGPPAPIDQPDIIVQANPVPAPKAGGLPFNLSNLGDIKNIIDRMGGIDGILATMGKVQKFVTTMQQFAPMIKLFMNKGGKAATANRSKGGAPRRRATRRRTSGRRPGSKRPAGRR